MLTTLKSMSEFSGLWEHQTNPACTESVRVLKLDATQKKKQDIHHMAHLTTHFSLSHLTQKKNKKKCTGLLYPEGL